MLAISYVCCFWEPQLPLCWWTLCVWAVLEKVWMDCRRWSWRIKWDEKRFIQYLPSQGLMQHYSQHTSHTHTHLSAGFLPPVCLHRPSLWRKKKKLFIHNTIHQGFTPSLASLTEWNTLSLLLLQRVGKNSGIESENVKSNNFWHHRTLSEEHRHRRCIVLWQSTVNLR